MRDRSASLGLSTLTHREDYALPNRITLLPRSVAVGAQIPSILAYVLLA